jgi:hypothetical protein
VLCIFFIYLSIGARWVCTCGMFFFIFITNLNKSRRQYLETMQLNLVQKHLDYKQPNHLFFPDVVSCYMLIFLPTITAFLNVKCKKELENLIKHPKTFTFTNLTKKLIIGQNIWENYIHPNNIILIEQMWQNKDIKLHATILEIEPLKWKVFKFKIWIINKFFHYFKFQFIPWSMENYNLHST